MIAAETTDDSVSASCSWACVSVCGVLSCPCAAENAKREKTAAQRVKLGLRCTVQALGLRVGSSGACDTCEHTHAATHSRVKVCTPEPHACALC